ncbi:PA2817 family protein [Oceaniserpentilla sp. 4NH20-0058]|uniref:PA2817 family protein n=1 Tax=Oceaniserpentilla sp. 4NH20-0058 TaxID=3127660 RepID=UPI0031029C11
MQTYNPHHHTLILLKDFLQSLQQGIPFNQETLDENDASFLQQLKQVIAQLEARDVNATFEGQDWLARLFRNYPTFAPHLGREVLWYFGGEALHFMPDEEIARFQQLDDLVADADDSFDYLASKQAIFKANS